MLFPWLSFEGRRAIELWDWAPQGWNSFWTSSKSFLFAGFMGDTSVSSNLALFCSFGFLTGVEAAGVERTPLCLFPL